MGVFRFKKFSVVNDRSAMKVNTDGVLLGVSMTVEGSPVRLLDIGTGTGTIALIAAQRLSEMGIGTFHIDAIDIDGPSAAEAGENFSASPWASSMSAVHTPLSEFKTEGHYDMIFSNPPYFEDSLENPEARKAGSRHTSSLSFRDILVFAESALAPDGRLSLVLPFDRLEPLLREARSRGFHASRLLRIRTSSSKPFTRVVAEFSRLRVGMVEEELSIQDKGEYTPEYLSLVKDFYLFA
ncbi:MAG: methyltransferase [Bacteroidales bacterium]|nr:methyltransferase [Bacteroidales bacterium]